MSEAKSFILLCTGSFLSVFILYTGSFFSVWSNLNVRLVHCITIEKE